MFKLHTIVAFTLLAASLAFTTRALTAGGGAIFTGEDGTRLNPDLVFGVPARQVANLEKTMTENPTVSKKGYPIARLSDERVAELAKGLTDEERRILLDHGTEAGLLRHAARQQDGGHLCVPPVRAAAVQQRDEVHERDGLAQLLFPGQQGPPGLHRGHLVRHEADRDPLRPLRRAPGACVRGRPEADGPAVLPEQREPEVLREGRRRCRRRRSRSRPRPPTSRAGASGASRTASSTSRA
jgi:hypothetical protein